MLIGQELKLNNRNAIIFFVLSMVLVFGLLFLRFSLRNDQITYFLPVRMYMSDAFNHNEWLFWNPYVSGSYPIHSDMQGPVWNPIVLLFSWLFNYNVTLLSIELLIYYCIGAIGCFYLIGNFSRNLYTGITMALIYSFGAVGATSFEFMSWIGSLAFLPWVFHFYYRVLKNGKISDSIKLGLSVWLMLVCGYPSFLIFQGYILIAFTLTYGVILINRKDYSRLFNIIKNLFIAFLLFAAVSLPALHSYFEFLPWYGRSGGAPDIQFRSEAFDWNYPISLLLPGGGYFSWRNNLYIGLIPLLALCIPITRKKLSWIDIFILIGFVYTFLFSVGVSTPVRLLSAEYIPFLGSFGFSHSVRIFLIVALMYWIAPRLDNLFERKDPAQIKTFRYGAIIVAALLMAYFLLDQPYFKNESFRPVYYASFIWQTLLLAVLLSYKRIFSSARNLFLFILVDLIGCAVIVTPATGLSLTAPKIYNENASTFYDTDWEKYLLAPESKTTDLMTLDPRKEVNAIKLIPRKNFPSNTRIDTIYHYLRNNEVFGNLISRPFVFGNGCEDLQVHDLQLGYNSISIRVTTSDTCQLIIQQAFYKRWRSGDPEHVISSYEGALMQVALKKGENDIRLYYYRRDLLVESFISLSVLVLSILILAVQYRKKHKA